MHYSLEKISTVAACDTLLALSQKKKLNLERKRRNLGESIEAFSARIDQIGQDSVLVQALLAIFTTAYRSLPEGTKYKASLNVKIKRLELRQTQLEKRAFTCNVRALLAKQLKYNRLDSQVRAIDNYIAAVQNRRMTLVNPPLRVNSGVSRSPVVHQKSRTLKRAYNFQGLFSGSWIVHQKQDVANTVYKGQRKFAMPILSKRRHGRGNITLLK